MKELLYLKDEQLKDLIEKLFISYRETFSDAKKVLDKHSIGLAHHKVIHLLSMYEGISISDAKIHVLNHGLHYASCVFEGERVYDGSIFKLEEHTSRLFYSAERMGMTIPYTEKEINDA